MPDGTVRFSLFSETELFDKCTVTFEVFSLEIFEKRAASTWLYLVLNSRIKNYYRNRKETVELGALENVLACEGEELEQSVWLEQLRDTLAHAIARLPERQQQVVVLRYFQNKSSGEIGQILGISPGNARVLLSRALDSLEEDCRGLAVL